MHRRVGGFGREDQGPIKVLYLDPVLSGTVHGREAKNGRRGKGRRTTTRIESLDRFPTNDRSTAIAPSVFFLRDREDRQERCRGEGAHRAGAGSEIVCPERRPGSFAELVEVPVGEGERQARAWPDLHDRTRGEALEEAQRTPPLGGSLARGLTLEGKDERYRSHGRSRSSDSRVEGEEAKGGDEEEEQLFHGEISGGGGNVCRPIRARQSPSRPRRRGDETGKTCPSHQKMGNERAK
jgi:hypothetical protein